MTALLETRALSKSFGALRATRDVTFALEEGARHALIGPNGAGKTTFINLLTGVLAPSAGEVLFKGQDITQVEQAERVKLGIARTFQINRLFRGLSVLENVRVPLLFSGEATQASRRALECLEQVELAGKADKLPKELTQVEQRRLELARAIALRPQLLIADEAMAGLSHAEVDQIIALLLRMNAAGTAVIMIEHIMRAVTQFAERLIVFVAGRKIADGTPRDVLALPEVEDAYLGKQ